MTASNGVFTYWSLLGLSPESDSDQLKKAFRREAMRWHPDLNRNDLDAEERFKWINEAYKVLNDPDKRIEWEKAGKPGFQLKTFVSEPSSKPTSSETSKPDHDDTEKGANHFTSNEKLLLVLISIFFLFLVNNLTF